MTTIGDSFATCEVLLLLQLHELQGMYALPA